ncbi:MAG: hypothetical protein RR977_02755, partial [Oscillospiraceae bacterium]
MKKKWIVWTILVLLTGLYVFFAAPNLNPLYSDGGFFWAALISIYAIVGMLLNLGVSASSFTNGQFPVEDLKRKKSAKVWLIILATIWGLYFLMNIISAPLFHYTAYRDQMKQPVAKEFSSEVQMLDASQVPVVDKELAKILADRKLGEKPSLGSQVVLGDPTIQNVGGELIWAIPLHHSGFFKWFVNMDGADGYIIVSATNPQDVEYVDDYKIKIQPNSYLLFDLERKARFSDGLFTGMVDYSFELDDNRVPYWVVTTYKNEWLYSLKEASGIILINASTGETSRHGLDDVPDWVDRVQPEAFIMNQIDNQGEYVKGVFNFSNSGKFRTSPGDIIVYNNGRCYLFTGITSVGVDQSTIGFYMVDMVTKEASMYQISGATENAAMESAEGKVQDLGYVATFPLILNVDGQPTYFMTLKDNAGLIKKYAFVSVKDFMLVGVGDTMGAAMKDYRALMKSQGSQGIAPEVGETKSEKGVVDRIASETIGGNTMYLFTLLEDESKAIYRAAASVSDELALTISGDAVSFGALSNDDNVVEITAF